MNNTSSNPLNSLRVSSLKGIGEKTEKLFRKVRVDNLNQLLHYYPRAYDVFEEPVDSGPVAKTLCSQCRGTGFNPWSGN